ncbi:type ISP restriction/modification enzyme [Silanimonas sp.]|uniref:DEAD/DEAH box helicase n=1 Tax=Silanimonas sp. TaxID=1929290 RepID=UPI0022BA84D9|nr:type ISP restriction/modification enzyme [Silanimonas sp.]MCZ8061768.1 DEAD/DEAH box helicase family protein [Silanimonas sp.]
MTALERLLESYRSAAVSEREKGTYFEELILCYLQNEATYRDLYAKVQVWTDWATANGFSAKDDGIDLVAEVAQTGEVHAIQCKFYAPDYKLQKKDIDSFFTASGRKPFSHRVIVSTTDHWSEHAENALVDQQPPVSKITLRDLEESQIDWAKYQPKSAAVLKPKKSLRPHQESALKAVTAGLKEADRGKLIMACGTGKTFTSLKIAESLAGRGKRVLFLVPSLSLLSQTLTEWTQESAVPLHSFAVCSDSDVGKKKGRKEDDAVQTFAHELRYPATTDAKRLAQGVAVRTDADHMTVVFSTYHSIEVIHDAQANHGLDDFDLIVCDEAHRTTGATFDGEDESAFVRVHDAAYIRADKRLYMTATPRIYGDGAKAMAERDNVALYSMDNEAWYGKQLFVITFSEAVKRGLLVDYKVIVLAVEESHINRRLQALLKDENNTLRVDDAAKIVGCWKALAKLGIHEDGSETPEPMRRAVAFCQVIEPGKGGKTHKVSSKEIAGMFQAVVEAYQDAEDIEDGARLTCEAQHVDGGMNASEKESKLDWLKAPTPPDTCRVLSNVRCLSEGVDVPALDAVLFLTPRNSQVDVVQSVGRVMRNAPGKRRGYVVLPVVIPAGVEPHDALNDNQTYKVVWQVLQALRSHDDRFDAMVNKLDLVGPDRSKMEVIAITDAVQRKSSAQKDGNAKKVAKAKGKFGIGEDAGDYGKKPEQVQIEFEVGEIERALYAKVVEKCGNRHHWEDWANDIAKIARTHIDRINAVLQDPASVCEREAFLKFSAELRDDLNDSISDEEIVEMLAQHLVTKPVFDALFDGYSFASQNPMALAMQDVLDLLGQQRLDKEVSNLEDFYASVRLRAEGITSAEGKQKIVKELYDKFFNGAFPVMAKRLGIVYTPVEAVDFMLRSVDLVLRKEFGQSIGSRGVHVLDPFVGTGTFIARLLQIGLIDVDDIRRKYREEIHANELVLLAYYIAAINIEAAYHDLVDDAYSPFGGICLTDTFQMYEKEDMIDELLVQNSSRRKRQKDLDIRVIIGNPPYSSGDKDDSNSKSVDYPELDRRISQTYVAKSSNSMGKSKIYDSYIRALRWASDKVSDRGLVCFISGNGFLDKPANDGLRRALLEEFSTIYVLNLRGDIRKDMLSRGAAREGENIFGSRSMTGIAITLLVKNAASTGPGRIFYCDVGDDLSEQEKIGWLSESGSFDSLPWTSIQPDRYGDWINQRASGFESFVLLGTKKAASSGALFATYSMGLSTHRDAWTYNFSRVRLEQQLKSCTEVFNAEARRFAESDGTVPIEDFVDRDKFKIKWTSDILSAADKGKELSFDSSELRQVLYRPFQRQWGYFGKDWSWTRHLMPSLFPSDQADNLVICITGVGARTGFSVLMSNSVPELHTLDTAQCFPRYRYEQAERGRDVDLFSSNTKPLKRHDAIASERVEFFKAIFGNDISADDIFYYVYGLLHSEQYRKQYGANLEKELPRIPVVRSTQDFLAFCRSGRLLAELHLNYETVPTYAGAKIDSGGKQLADADYRVEKMRFGKSGKDKDRTTIHYNAKITVTGIPLEAYDYVVNGKPAIEWVMERQCVKTDKDSGIVNDANDWAIETMGNPRYPLELLLRVVTVSLETMKIVRSLPALDIREDG